MSVGVEDISVDTLYVDLNATTLTLGGDYDELTNKPKINNVTLTGNKTTSDLSISYNDLTNKPTIPDISGKADTTYVNTQDNLKVDKVSTNNKIYGTNSSGSQTTYNKSDFAMQTDIPDISGKADKTYVDTQDNLKADTTYVNTQLATKQNVLTNGYSDLTNKPKINSIELSGNKTSADLLMYTKAETNSAIASAVGDITSFDYQVVETLPQTGIKGTIYLTEKTTTEQGDIYNEYLWINNAWEKIGNTSVDISGKVDKVTTTNKLYGTDSVGGQTTYDKSDFASASDLSGKLDKVTTATTNKQVYVKKEDGTQNVMNIVGGDYGIVAYYANSRLICGTPTAPNYATNKQYVDAKFPTIKTTLDNVLVANSQYYLGEQTTLNITLPNSATQGQLITVDFTSGTTATTLSISGNVAGDITYSPSVNTLVELNFKWDGVYWKMIANSVDIPVGE